MKKQNRSKQWLLAGTVIPAFVLTSVADVTAMPRDAVTRAEIRLAQAPKPEQKADDKSKDAEKAKEAPAKPAEKPAAPAAAPKADAPKPPAPKAAEPKAAPAAAPKSTAQDKREERQEKREEKRDNAREERQEKRQDVREDRKDQQKDKRQDAREEKREQRKDTQQEKRENAREQRQEKREDAKQDAKDERQEKRQDAREEKRDDRKDQRQDAREEKRDDRKDQRQDAREEKRDDRRDAREERRDDKRDARRDRRDDRRDARRFEELKRERREERQGNRTVIREGDRTIIREGSRTIIRRDETDRFRRDDRDVRVVRRGGETRTISARPNGMQIITVTDDRGRLLRRIRRGRDGREVIIIDNTFRGAQRGDFYVNLPPPVIRIPRERYIVEAAEAPPAVIYDTLMAPPVEAIERRYTLDEVLYSPDVRARMPRVDLDTVNFEFGSWELSPGQVDRLAPIADGIRRAVERNPNEVFLIEGHTDAVGSDLDNLSLSDRRAETVAVILTDAFGVPPENLTVQGYGEQYLKIDTPEPERQNRRVTVRRITPLITGEAR